MVGGGGILCTQASSGDKYYRELVYYKSSIRLAEALMLYVVCLSCALIYREFVYSKSSVHLAEPLSLHVFLVL